MRALILLVLAAACGSSGAARRVSETVDDDLVLQLPPEGRVWTYEAENEVIIALDRHDSALEDVREADLRIEEAERQLDAAKGRGGKGREVAEAKLAWREKQKEAAQASVKETDSAIYCARAGLELTKAQMAVRFDLPIDDAEFVKKYEEQVQECSAELEELRKATDGAGQAAAKAREAWRRTRAGYAQKTGDHNHGTWID